jgi:predicted Zn-dependent protease
MNLTYKARYFNGQSSRPFVADVSVNETGIDITYYDEHNHYKQVKWEKGYIKELQIHSSIVMLQFEGQQLEVTDRDFIAAYRQHSQKSSSRKIRLSTPAIITLSAAGFMALLVLSYFTLLPFVADRVAQHFPVEYEIEMGEKMYNNILAESRVDKHQSAAITRFFKNLNIKSEYPVHIAVIKDTIVNAYALPGGGIIVYDAIIRTMKTPEELAALLAHEYSHVQLKHTTRNVFRSLAGYFFISIIFSDANGLVNLVIDNANQLQNLSYSRELEHEADANGLQILKQNKLATSGMISLFQSLKQSSTQDVNEIISTHPDLENRIQFVKEFTEQNEYTPESNDSLIYYFNQLKTK